MALTIVLALLAVVSLSLLAWQVLAGSRFPLHERPADAGFSPPVVLLKPLKGCDEHTADCLRSWLRQEYPGPVRVLFGVAEQSDPVCKIVHGLLQEFPNVAGELVITPAVIGPNAKVSNLAQLYRKWQKSETDTAPPLICISDADVRVPMDFLKYAVLPLKQSSVGCVTSFYQLANPQNFAMEVEAVAVNSDFWSQVLQSNTLKPQDFALGAVMITRPAQIEAIGGFESLADYLADDYQLGNRIAKTGLSVALATGVAECWDPPLAFRQVWNHQLRWARTIRASQPLPYFFSIVNNVSLWTTLAAVSATKLGIYRVAPGFPWHFEAWWLACWLLAWDTFLLARVGAAQFLAERLTGRKLPWSYAGVVLTKDFLQAAVWAVAFLGNTVTWRGRKFRIARGGKLIRGGKRRGAELTEPQRGLR